MWGYREPSTSYKSRPFSICELHKLYKKYENEKFISNWSWSEKGKCRSGLFLASWFNRNRGSCRVPYAWAWVCENGLQCFKAVSLFFFHARNFFFSPSWLKFHRKEISKGGKMCSNIMPIKFWKYGPMEKRPCVQSYSWVQGGREAHDLNKLFREEFNVNYKKLWKNWGSSENFSVFWELILTLRNIRPPSLWALPHFLPSSFPSYCVFSTREHKSPTIANLSYRSILFGLA